jgi:S1-C subfamily serine protease
LAGKPAVANASTLLLLWNSWPLTDIPAHSMPGRIFISYRRDDARGDARSIHDRLVRKFGEANVFMDVDSLLAGQRFDHQLDKALADCDVLLAVIGPRWMEALAEKARGEERDYVKDEIAAALKRQIVVIPVLVGQEERMPPMPRASELPEDIRDLALYQKHSITHESFSRNIEDLIAAINAVQKARRTSPPWKVPAMAAGGLAAVALVAAAIVYRGEIGAMFGTRQAAETPPAAKGNVQQAAPAAQKTELSPAEIAERYGKATVGIQLQWRLYDRASGRAVFHKSWTETVEGRSVRLPAYLQAGDHILPWLTTDDEEQRNYPVQGVGAGTGFVASPQGFILTTKTIGAGWADGFRPSGYLSGDRAFLLRKEGGRVAARMVSIRALNMPSWRPEEEGAILFPARLAGGDSSDLPAGSKAALTGRNDSLIVRFLNSNVDVNAELVGRAPEQNVALLKVTVPELAPALLASDDAVKVGARVAALGYVGTFGGSPTIAEGIVRSPASHDAADMQRSNIQTSIQIGYGTSGAPVFDAEGKVIGIVSFFVSEGPQAGLYAVPIRYGRALLQPQAR